jgi:hypothetical protein
MQNLKYRKKSCFTLNFFAVSLCGFNKKAGFFFSIFVAENLIMRALLSFQLDHILAAGVQKNCSLGPTMPMYNIRGTSHAAHLEFHAACAA